MQEITLEQRLDSGNISISELVKLSGRSRSAIYADIKLGRLKVIKFGKAHTSAVFVRGPDARAYMAGEHADA